MGILLRPLTFSSAAAAPLRSVVIVPFAAVADEPVHVAALNRLGHDVTSALGDSLRQVRVVPASRAAPFAGRAGDAPAIGREANVRFVVEGDARVGGGQVAVTLRLIDTLDDRQLDSARVLADASDLDDTKALGLRLTSRIRVMVSQAIAGIVRTAGEERASAQDLVDLANSVPIRDPAANAREARRLASAAIKRDPRLASAWAARAEAGTMLYFTDFSVDSKATREEIDADSFQAVTLDPKDVSAWIARANALRIRGNMEGAFAALDRAQELDGSRFQPQFVRGWFHLDAGSPQETLKIVARLRPVLGSQDSGAAVQACAAHLLLGAYDEAIVECERVTSWDLWNVPASLAAAHAMLGDATKAAAAREMLLKVTPAFTVSRYEERFGSGLTPRGRALDQAHFVAGLRKAGVPE
jgi:TolB-like protein